MPVVQLLLLLHGKDSCESQDMAGDIVRCGVGFGFQCYDSDLGHRVLLRLVDYKKRFQNRHNNAM